MCNEAIVEVFNAYTLTLMMANMGATKVQMACEPSSEESQQLSAEKADQYGKHPTLYVSPYMEQTTNN